MIGIFFFPSASSLPLEGDVDRQRVDFPLTLCFSTPPFGTPSQGEQVTLILMSKFFKH